MTTQRTPDAGKTMGEVEQACYDLDLMKLAAKAAGMRWVAESCGSLLMPFGKGEPAGKRIAVNGMDSGWLWNPRDDDGDAFRLAVKLSMSVTIGDTGDELSTSDAQLPNGRFANCPHKGDPYAATRCAITIAAAAAGLPMRDAGNPID